MISKRVIPSTLKRLGLFSALLILVLLIGGRGASQVQAVATNLISLNVVSADGSGPVGDYEYIINVDDTGSTVQRSPDDPLEPGCSPEYSGYPGSCRWVSIAGVPSGSSPIFTQGDQRDFDGTLGTSLTLPNGDYLVSVLAGGYKLGGQHFTVPHDPGVVTVELNPSPLPAGTIQASVFEDISPVNGAPDLPAEHGLAGFEGHIADYGGEVTTDIFGNPLGAEYDEFGEYIPGSGGIVRSKCYVVSGGIDLGFVTTDAQGNPLGAQYDTNGAYIPGTGDGVVGPCPTATNGHAGFADGLTVQGKLIIPNVGPNRYGLAIVPPDGTTWIQTTTLEGLHEWDAWVMEGATGLDTEFVIAGEPFPAIIFGYVAPTNNLAAGNGSVSGVVDAVKVYVPPKGGTGLPGTIWANAQGMKTDKPIPNPWIALSDLSQGDTAVYVGQGDANGAFDISGVPDGNYILTWWDEPQDYILDLFQITVAGGQVDMGVLPLTGWWTTLEGYVFNDLNRNGVKDPGEGGISGYTLTMRKRENSLMDRGAKVVTTEADGYYFMENTYPMTQWLVMEAYNDLFYTTGVTYQTDNQPTPTTILGAGVDINVLPIIGLGGRLDWGVHAYDPTGANGIDPQNGGIVGTVSYDTTRAELDPRYAGAEDWQPSIPGLTVNLYSPVACTAITTPLTVLNAGFEGVTLNDGQWTTAFTVAGWSTLSGANGEFNPTTAHLSSEAAEGLNTAYSNGGTISQVLTGTLTAGTTYELSVQVGDRKDTAFPGYTVELLAGGELLASADQAAFPGVDDGWVTASVTYEALATDSRLDQPLEIRLSSAGIQTNFDDVQLTASTNPPCSTGPGLSYMLDSDGAIAKGQLLNSVTTEQWVRPSGCVARDVDGNPLVHGVDENVLPTDPDAECLEGPLQGVQFGNEYAAVDGNYGFGDGCFTGTFGFDEYGEPLCDGGEFVALPGGLDYLVEVEIPNDALGRPLYKVTREEDINVGEGDEFIPAVPPPACAGSLHTVDVFGFEDDEYPEFVGNGSNGVPLGVTVPPSEPTVNDSFADIGDVIYEGLQKPLCDTKLVPLANGKSIAPTFFLFTDVPLPGRAWGLIVDDLNFAADPTKLLLGEKAGVPFAPVGIYDYTNKHITTIESDYNGLFDVLLPSTNRINCPTPSGVCANMFRFVGNDPGTPGRLNLNYKPQFRTISADFEVFPGLIVPADLAPTQVGVVVQLPSGQFNDVSCSVDPATPQIFAVSQPYVDESGSFTINGLGFATNPEVTLDGIVLPVSAGNTDTELEVTVPASTPGGPYQLNITNTDTGQSTLNGLTFHVLRGTGPLTHYNPNLYEVGPTTNPNYSVAKENAGTWFVEVESLLPATASHAIQAALDAAAASPGDDLVVVYPGVPTPGNQQLNPRGAYYENLIVTSPVKLQGVGPGSPDGSVPGSIIDGLAFGGDSPVFVDWWTRMVDLTWDGNQSINDGAVISIFAQDGDFTAGFAASIDGFDLRGGNQQGFPGNINQVGGLPTGLPPGLTTQGGAIFANAYARYLQITNNTVQNNGGAYGTIRIGTPDLPEPDNQNDNIRIANNRIFANGGTNLAGGIGLFAGADNYEVAGNDICGNFSAEYGGGISHYGLSPNGVIHDNRIYFNSSYDEGGGVMIAGALPTDPLAFYNAPNGPQGSGPVDIYNNLIQANLANDDGGGLRFLMAGNFPMNVYNNMIVNNVSTHEGGGISLNDAPNVRVYNNTIMKNLTTATAITSNGQPAPAGLSTSQNSDQLLGALPVGAPVVSDPLLFNNIFWDNRAGTWDGLAVTGLGDGDADHWDLGVANLPYALAPTNSVIQQLPGGGVRNYTDDASNSHSDPAVVTPYDLSVAFNVWRNNPNFVGAILVAVDLPPELLGDYHLLDNTSPAFDLGVPIKNRVNAPVFDIDGDGRPGGLEFDSGADELMAGDPVPLVTGVNATPNPTTGATSVTLAATGNSVTDITAAEWFTETASVVGPATPMTFSGPGPLWSLSVAIDISGWSTGSYTLTVRAQNGTGWSENATTNLVVTGPPAPLLYFSTVSNFEIPGLAGPFDDADIYSWNGVNYARVFDASAVGLPGGADIDALTVEYPDTFYMSFTGGFNLTGVGNIDDSDIVKYVAGGWSIYFDGSDVGLTTNAEDVDAFEILSDGSVIVSTTGNGNVPGVGGFNDEDLLRCSGSFGLTTTCNWSVYFDGSDVALSAGSENVNGVSVSAGNIYLSTAGNFSAAVPNQQLSGLGMDVFACNGATTGPASNCNGFSMYFNGIGNGILDTLDAIDLP